MQSRMEKISKTSPMPATNCIPSILISLIFIGVPIPESDSTTIKKGCPFCEVTAFEF